MTPAPQAERDARAAKRFPLAWRDAAGPGERNRKRRHALRQRAEIAERIEVLKAAGATCATCRAFAKYPHGPGRICEVNSDFSGYAMASADNLCTDWSAR